MKYISVTQAVEIQGFFRIIRRTFINSLLTMLLFVPMTVRHFTFYFESTKNTETLCFAGLGIKIPCSLFYSRMDESNLKIFYPVSMLIFCLLRFSASVRNLISEIVDLYRSYFMKPSDEFLFSQILLNPWNFNINKEKEAFHL